MSYIIGEDFRKYVGSEHVLPSYKVYPTIYGRYVSWFSRNVIDRTAKLGKRYDLIVVTKQLHVPVLGDVVYMHFPDLYPGVEALYYPSRYVENKLLRIYSLLSRMLSELLLKLFEYLDYRPWC